LVRRAEDAYPAQIADVSIAVAAGIERGYFAFAPTFV
jgi:hypothetical protein